MSESSSFSPPSLVMATIGLSLATFMQVLDTTIANVALPTISGNLGVSSEQGTWVITSFAVSNAIALPLTGWLARRVGEVRLFIAAALLFVLASFLCGIAQSMPSLVGFRALQGFVAGPLYPITQTLLISIYPPAKRGMALALLAMVTVVAPIAGPILGGWITDDYSWPWIFFINVPVGLFAAFVVYQQLKARPVVIKKAPMDYVGLIALVIGVGALQIVLDKGNDLDWFESNFIVGGALIAAIAWPSSSSGNSPTAIRSSTCACSPTATSPPAPWRWCWAMPRSSASTCCSRNGYRPRWATPPPGPGWPPRQSASSRCSSRRWSAATPTISTCACSPACRSWRWPSPASCAPTSPPRSTTSTSPSCS